MKSLFYSNNHPFFSIGGQLSNSTSADPVLTERTFALCSQIGLNTVAAPVSWEMLEPTESEFNFTTVDMLIDTARRYGLKLVILWFGTWKNGTSSYAPSWVKDDSKRFLYAVTRDTTITHSISPLCKNATGADMKAFGKLCARIDSQNSDGTVIAIQVENEPGIQGSDMDYSPKSLEMFNESIPESVKVWLNKDGTWRAVFGAAAEEMFSAYCVARYVDSVARAGKEHCSLPMYTNVWLGEMHARVPGVSYPSGGAVTRTFKLWKQIAKHLDAIAPDIYLSDYATCDKLFNTYSSEGNILYLPESMPVPLSMLNSIRAVAEYGLCGIHIFGIDMLVSLSSPEASKATTSPEMSAMAATVREMTDSFRILSYSRPLIESYSGSGRLYAVAQYEGVANQFIDFGDYYGEVVYLNPDPLFGEKAETNMDSRHFAPMYSGYRAKGFIVYEGNGVFYLTGDAYRLFLIPKKDAVSAIYASHFSAGRSLSYISVTEGSMNEDAVYTASRTRNGDEIDHGLWVTSDVGVVKAILNTNI